MVTVDQGSARYPSLQIVADEPLRLVVTDDPSTLVMLLTHRSLTRQDVIVLSLPGRRHAYVGSQLAAPFMQVSGCF